ncbi:MAG: hypothetical protein WBD02_05680, partial [Acidimicrobiia bacterium]
FAAVKAATPDANTTALSPVISLDHARRGRVKVFAIAAAVAVLLPTGVVLASKLGDDARSVRVRPAAPGDTPGGTDVALPLFASEHLDPDGYLLARLEGNTDAAALHVSSVQAAWSPQAVEVSEVSFGDLAPDSYRATDTARPYSLGTFTDPQRADFWAVVVLADAPNGIDGMLGMVPDGTVSELASVQPTKKYRDPFGRGAEGFRFSANGVEVAVVGTGITPDDLEKIGENVTNGPRSSDPSESPAALMVKSAITLPEVNGGMPEGQVLPHSPLGWVRSNASRVPEVQSFIVDYAPDSKEASDSEVTSLRTYQSLAWNTVGMPNFFEAGHVKVRDGVTLDLVSSVSTESSSIPKGNYLSESEISSMLQNFVGVNHDGFATLVNRITDGLLTSNIQKGSAEDCQRPHEAFGWTESGSGAERRCRGGKPETEARSTSRSTSMVDASPTSSPSPTSVVTPSDVRCRTEVTDSSTGQPESPTTTVPPAPTTSGPPLGCG